MAEEERSGTPQDLAGRPAPNQVFGEPVRQGDTVLVPVAKIRFGADAAGNGAVWRGRQDRSARSPSPPTGRSLGTRRSASTASCSADRSPWRSRWSPSRWRSGAAASPPPPPPSSGPTRTSRSAGRRPRRWSAGLPGPVPGTCRPVWPVLPGRPCGRCAAGRPPGRSAGSTRPPLLVRSRWEKSAHGVRPAQRLVQGDAEPPDVHGRGHLGTPRLLGGQVVERAGGAALPDPAGQAQIQQHRSSAHCDHIGWFDVQVHPAAPVQVAEHRAQCMPSTATSGGSRGPCSSIR